MLIRRRRSSLLLSVLPAVVVVGSLLVPTPALGAPIAESRNQPAVNGLASDQSPLTTLAKAAKKKAAIAAEDAVHDKLATDNPYTAGNYIVTLKADPAATYTGGAKSFARTQPKAGQQLNTRSKKVVDYTAHLERAQVDVAKSAGATIGQQYTIATNGFSSTLTAGQAKKLAQDSRVLSVTKSQLLHIQAENIDSGVHFLGLDGATGVWSAIGGFAEAGKGVVIGELDTGIAPENASFAAPELQATSADGQPTRDASGTISFKKANGATFTSVCQAGKTKDDEFTAADCNTKIIGAHYYADGFGDPAAIALPKDGEYMSPRDGNGHGSHTASTAAGNHGVAATVAGKSMGDISGVAPAAKISVYKVCWTGRPNVSEDGCSEADSLAAIDQAIRDGVDVINYSIGGGAAQTTISTIGAAYLRAAVAGVFVAAAAGNSGPKPSTLDNAAPWITTVAASTIEAPEATVALGDGSTFLGVSIGLPDSGLTGELVSANLSGKVGAAKPQFCGPGTLDPAKVKDKIVFCEREGEIARAVKSQEVKDAGGVGMLLVNSEANSLDSDIHAVPTVHVDADALSAIRSYSSSAGATVTFSAGNTSSTPDFATPQIAGFSSRGPLIADGGDLIKPDVTAPGVGILAATANHQDQPGTYAFESGTSMATPHVAGLAAIYLGVHPGKSPAEVKSAIMTTAHDLVDASGDPSEDVFAQGAGQADPSKFLDPGMLYLSGEEDWNRYAASLGLQTPTGDALDPSDLNLPSIGIGALPGTQTVTRTATSTRAGTFIADPVSIPGITTTVTPSTLTFTAVGESIPYQVSFTRTTAALNVFATGYLRWRSGTTTVSSAIAVRPSDFSVPGDIIGTGSAGTSTIPVQEGMTDSIGVQTNGFAKGAVVNGSVRADQDKVAQRYIVEVPEGTTFTRFDLDATRDDVDLDMTLGWVGGSDTTPIPRGQSITESADERVDVTTPDPGHWVVSVYGFEGDGPIDYTLSTYSITPESAEGTFVADPEVLDMVQATTGTENVSWAGLLPHSKYLGIVNFGSSGARTVVTVSTDAGAVTPADPDGATLAISPDYVRAGQSNVSMVAGGLTPGEPYTLHFDSDPDVVVNGNADDAGDGKRYVTIPESISLGRHTATLEFGDGHSVDSTFTVSTLVINMLLPSADQNFGGKPAIALEAEFGGTGTLGFSMTSEDGKTSYLSQAPKAVSTPADFPWVLQSVVTDVGHPEAGIVKASVWVIEPGGVIGQRVDISFAVDSTSNGSASFTQADDDPSAVVFTLIQNSDKEMLPTLTYKLCSGPMIFGEHRGLIGRSDAYLDMTGVVSITAALGDRILATYVNRDSSRCADGAPLLNRDLWVEATDNSAADAAKPIHLTISNAVATRSASMEVIVGAGTYVYSQPHLFDEIIPTAYSPVPNQPRVIRSIDVAAGGPVWTRTEYEQDIPKGGSQTGPVTALQVRRTLVSALTPAMLAAIDPNAPIPADPTDPGTPANPSDPGAGNGGTTAPAASAPHTGLAYTGVAIGLPILAGALFALLLGSVLVTRRRRMDSESIADTPVDDID